MRHLPQHSSLLSSQLEQLCQAEQIEHTLHLLCVLNHWAKARDRLFYADRQGLYTVKDALLRQAYANGSIEARAYIDGVAGFATELNFESAADIAAEAIIWKLEEIAHFQSSAVQNQHDHLARQFYIHFTGKPTFAYKDIEALEVSPVRDFIFTRLQQLAREARATRQPIPCEQLMKLCIAPSDLLMIRDNRYYDLSSWDSWDRLDMADLRKIDPEGLSLVALHYNSVVSHYIFHIPLRLAETFLPSACLNNLHQHPRSSRETGEYYGRAITEAESLQYPIADVLSELGIDIASVCPHLLNNKQEYIHTQGGFDLDRRTNSELDEEADSPFWDDFFARPSKQTPPSTNNQWTRGACPLCLLEVDTTPGNARILHWQQDHPSCDLTFTQASWLLNLEVSKKQFYQEHPPDYRTPDKRGLGTRYWTIATLVDLYQPVKDRSNAKD